jgi:hypothetical protein
MDREENKRGSRYLVSISGSNTHFECPINTMADFDELEEILRILKKKLQGA